MIVFDEKKSVQINRVVKQFLESQLGENPTEVSSYLNEDILTAYAFGVVSPAEEALLHSGSRKLWIDYKIRQFETVKEELSLEIGDFFDQAIRRIYTTLTDDGIRIIHVSLNQNK